MKEHITIRKKPGHLKEYEKNIDGNFLIFEGEIKNDIRNGKGKEYLKGQLKFDGEFLNGKRWNGKIYNPKNNTEYEIKNGNGIIEDYESEVCSFEGELKDGKRYNGKVKEDYYLDSFHYHFDGVYVNGIKKGKGYENGKLIYEGEKDENNLNNGKGVEYYEGEKTFEGEFFEGNKWNGKGKEYKGNIDNKLIYEGTYFEGKRWNGKGEEYDDDRKLIYKGSYFEGKRWNGEGKEYEDDKEGLIYEGSYFEGKRWNGKGKEYDNEGELIFNGEYIKGKKKRKNKEKIII